MALLMQNVFDTPDVSGAEPSKGIFEPISLEELMDPANTLPRETLDSVAEATRYIQASIQEQKRRAANSENVQSLDDRLVAARKTGPGGPVWAETARELDDLVIEWQKVATKRLNGAQLRWVRARIQDRFLGYDAIEPLRRDTRVTEIIIQSAQPKLIAVPGREPRWDRGTRIEMGGGLAPVPGVVFPSDDDVYNLVSDGMGAAITVEHPRYSGSLPDGSRIEVKHRIITNRADTFLALRRHPRSGWTLRGLIDNNTVNAELARDLARWTKGRLNVLIAGSTGSGKALEVTTPIPTPGGYVAMGDLVVGDTVFDEAGSPCRVIGAYDVMYGHDCYRVSFSDGSTVVADAEHLWVTETADGVCATRTTLDLAQTLLTSSGLANHRLPGANRPVEFPEADLPADPARIGKLMGELFCLSEKQPGDTSAVDALHDAMGAASGCLSAFERFLFASVQQRRAFLGGFVSAVDNARTRGWIPLPTSHPELVSLLRSVVVSLGMSMTTTGRFATLHSGRRTVIGVDAVASTPVRCIAVDSPNRLFLAGPGWVPTHNTTLSNAVLGCVDPAHHVLILEDTAELNPPPYVFASFGITRTSAGLGDNIDLRAHIRSALRSRPDILIVGESRGGELVDVLTAMSTGHPGSMTTLHADSGPDTVVRMRRMLAESGEISREDIPQLISTAVDLLIFQGRLSDGRRRVLGVWEIIKPDAESVELVDTVRLRRLYAFEADSDTHVKLGEVSSETLTRRGLASLPEVDDRWIDEIAAASGR